MKAYEDTRKHHVVSCKLPCGAVISCIHLDLINFVSMKNLSKYKCVKQQKMSFDARAKFESIR